MYHVVPLLVAIPLGAAFLMPLACRRPRVADVTSNLVLLALAVLSWTLVGEEIVYHMGAWPTPNGIDLRVDGLTTLMLLTINLLALVVAFYSVAYLCHYTERHHFYTLLLLMVAGLNGVVLTADLFNLYVFMELATIASYALVAFGGKDEDFEAAFKYAIFGGLSSSLILLGIGLLYGVTGTLNMSHLASRIAGSGATLPLRFVIALFVGGFGLKAALVPFHAWLPDAYPAAPAPVSALLAGVASKVVGVYVLARLLFNVFGMNDELLLLLRWMGGVTMVVGGLSALGQTDMKRMFAYSSLGQVGLIMLALGLGSMWGLVGALFHFVNHAVFKPLLFLNSGQAELVAGTRDLHAMRGLGQRIPVTAVTSLVGSLAISGIPPFNGFWSKLIIVSAAVQGNHVGWGLVAVVMSIVTLAYQLKLQKAFFAGWFAPTGTQETSESDVARASEPWLISLPMVLLAIGCLALSLLAVRGLEQPFLIEPAAEVLLRGPRLW